ncbi:substrate-binding domain-containing protein [Aeromonas hydrophila]|uniref:Tungsten ABC transporter substrate-binding protein n=1 Tax=Aeromonas hydrophila TaxID=644 RepID=A0ABD7G9H0_AERHY|nr:substrate-binding domain-containing protein [Aeromonas hydrophila]MBC8669861.1 substrate-binding domain-containing protein [Aeromonas hydrophila]MBC8687489.1 substrate-binding domain-containing protein [Aeromonas hydrophila]RCF50286.1 tungsten ABC transporter substrate-binding protein [Aeromonas hydrophila]
MITATVRKRLALALSSALLLSLPLWSAASHAETRAPIRLATTTSTEQSGLLGWLLPQFTKETGYPVQVMAAGTGQSLKMGENGDADLVMTHAPSAEKAFVEAGFGIEPEHLMYNDFVIVGPAKDPAGLGKLHDAAKALEAIKEQGQTFISRGDESGTHIKEKTLWQAADVKPEFAGYKSIGQGMGPTLTMASELGAYTLTDRGTWLAYQSKLDLAVLLEGDKRLFNPYQVILVNPKRYPDLNTEGARTLKNWLVSQHGQQLIGDFKVAGQPLFVADAKPQ